MVLKRVVTPVATPAAAAESAGANPAPWADEEAGASPAPAPVAAPAPQTAVAVAPRPSGALANPNANINVIRDLKNAYTVSWDSLAAFQATQGRFQMKDTNANMGDEILFELMSWQDQYVVSPNDDTAPKDTVKFSADGVTTNDGLSCTEHLQNLKEMGYFKARIVQRYVLVGAILSTEKGDGAFDGTLAQIDLSPKSKAQFDRYQIQAAFDIGKGKLTPADAVFLTMKTTVVTNAAKQQYTLVTFATAPKAE